MKFKSRRGGDETRLRLAARVIIGSRQVARYKVTHFNHWLNLERVKTKRGPNETLKPKCRLLSVSCCQPSTPCQDRIETIFKYPFTRTSPQIGPLGSRLVVLVRAGDIQIQEGPRTDDEPIN